MVKAGIRATGFGLVFVFLVSGCGGGSDGPVLTLTKIEPAVGAREGGTVVTLTGTGFVRLVQKVTFGRSEATNLRVRSDTTLTCVTPKGTTGPCDVGVGNDRTTVTMEDAFTYLPPVPTLTGVTPNEGPPGVGTRIRLMGTALDYEPVTVTLDGRSCGGVTVESDSAVSCTVPALRSGEDLTVAITTAGGTASLPSAFSYLVYPYEGTYYFVEFSGLTIDNEPGMLPSRIPAAHTRWGTLVTEGGGIHTGGEVWTNDQGVVTGPTAAPADVHQVTEDRRFTWGTSGNPELVGRISTDGSLAILGSVRVGTPPKLSILGRVEGGPHDEASLSGVYHVGAVFGDGPARGALWGSVEFDGMGGATSGFDYNVEGGVAGPFPGSDTYTVSTQGRVTYDLVGSDLSFEGQILQGGELVILSGGTVSPDFPVAVVLVRTLSAAGPSTFSGNYAFAAMLRGNPAWDANTGTAQPAGDGTGTVLDLLGHDGDVTWTDWPEAPFDFVDAVYPDGMLELYVDGGVTGGGGMDTRGAVMLGGDFAFLSGSRLPGERPMLWFLLR